MIYMVVTNPDIKRIHELKKQGLTVEEIAALYSITPRRVYQILNVHRVKKGAGPQRNWIQRWYQRS
ncbi:hypothetical protein [Thermococcus sp.]|uniref:hypothetical protein n=1 Tax=Thermococcus sp. TaxID=35749 RepID=UPI00262B0986|nr:hypothetical protein [Thermococcus sp.]